MDFKFYIDEKIDMHFTEDALNMLNNKNPKRGKFKSFIDDYGNNIFHYLSLSEDPIKSYSIWNNKIKNEDFNHLNNKRLNFIHYLYLNSRIEEADYFLQNISGINVNLDNLFLLSSIQKDENFIKKLILEKNIDFNYIDKNKESGIKHITLFHDSSILRKVLELGVNPNVPDIFGKTPLHYAAEMYDLEKYQILEDFYAIDNIKSHLGQKTPYEILERSKVRNPEEIERMKKRWENDRKKISSIFSK